MSTPTQDEVKLAVALLWEIGEDMTSQSAINDRRHLRRIAGLIERQQAEIERLRQAVEGKRAA